MHFLRKFLTIPVVFLLFPCAHAATEFEGFVPLELARYFAAGGGIYSSLPDNFPEFEEPDGLQVIGSLDRGFQQQVIFRTARGGEDAEAVLRASFEDQGWEELVPFEMSQPQAGFVYPDSAIQQSESPQSLCHDNFGTLTISSYEGEGNENRAYLSLNRGNLQSGLTCAQQDEQRSQRGLYNPGLPDRVGVRQYMPRLELPVENTSQPPFIARMAGFSGSTNDVETGHVLTIDWDTDEVYSHFASQLEAQGWVLDSNWSGEVSSGGNWTRMEENDQNLMGVLTVLERNEGNFDLKFRLLSIGLSRPGPFSRTARSP